MSPTVTPSAHAIVLGSSGPGRLVAGLTPTERTRRALAACGVADGPHGSPSILLLVAADALIEPPAIAALLGAAGAGVATLVAGDDLASPAALALPESCAPTHFSSAENLADLAGSLARERRLFEVDGGDALCIRVRDDATAQRASARLLDRLIRPTDGFLARHFDRHLSRPLSVRLVARNVSPNAVTAVATLVGLVGAALLASMHREMRVLGATLFVTSTILDGCDGEVARLALRCTDFGRRFDLIGDNVVNAAVFLGLGVALVHGVDGGVPGWVVYLTAIGFVLATGSGFLFSQWLARTGREFGHDWYERLTGRDFAYVILALAALGRLHWFLWMAAFGCCAFTAAVVACWAWLRQELGRAPA